MHPWLRVYDAHRFQQGRPHSQAQSYRRITPDNREEHGKGGLRFAEKLGSEVESRSALVSATEYPSRPQWRRHSSASESSLAVWGSSKGVALLVASVTLPMLLRKPSTCPENSVSFCRVAADRHGVSRSSMRGPPVCGSSANVYAACSRPRWVRVSVIPATSWSCSQCSLALRTGPEIRRAGQVRFPLLRIEGAWQSMPRDAGLSNRTRQVPPSNAARRRTESVRPE